MAETKRTGSVRSFAVVLLAVAALAVAPAGSAQVAGFTDNEVVFGMTGPITGPSKILGRQMRLGIEAAFAAQNRAGGVFGRKLTLAVADDGYEPERTKVVAKDLVEKRRIFGFIGNVGTATAAVSLPLALDKGLIYFGGLSGGELLRNESPDRLVFNYRASSWEETAAIVRYLVEVRRVEPGQIDLECSFCSLRVGASSGSMVPGVSLAPDDAVQRVAGEVERGNGHRGIVIWGPGEPLLAASTYVVLRRLSWLYPDLDLTVCTNGLLLPERLEELVRSGAKRLVVSVNALTLDTASQIYQSASYRARTYEGRDAGELVLQQQWNGLSNAVEAGLAVTAYVAVLPGINDGEAAGIRAKAEAVGAERVVSLEPLRAIRAEPVLRPVLLRLRIRVLRKQDRFGRRQQG